jgi:hypothetical protein
MTAATIDIGKSLPTATDPLWNHSAHTWLVDAAMLGVLAIVTLSFIALLCKRLDPRAGAKARR